MSKQKKPIQFAYLGASNKVYTPTCKDGVANTTLEALKARATKEWSYLVRSEKELLKEEELGINEQEAQATLEALTENSTLNKNSLTRSNPGSILTPLESSQH